VQLTYATQQRVDALAQRYGVSGDAVRTLLDAVARGGGTMAQFYHSELGGGGQWMSGGMTMVGDMFNSRLASTVSGLCSELAQLYYEGGLYEPQQGSYGTQQQGGGFMQQSSQWYPAELGIPSSSGSQNDLRYAVFPGTRRLALERSGQLTVYDTLDHQIGGVQQQQGGGYGEPSFTSQYGTFTVASLPRAQGYGNTQPSYEPQNAPVNQPAYYDAPQAAPAAQSAPDLAGPSGGSRDALATLERLADLVTKGLLTPDEFAAKKRELLARI
jgi:Short C-terminal domain